jgi:hypothetical protein
MNKQELLQQIEADLVEYDKVKKQLYRLYDEENDIESRIVRAAKIITQGEDIVNLAESFIGKSIRYNEEGERIHYLHVEKVQWDKWEIKFLGEGFFNFKYKESGFSIKHHYHDFKKTLESIEVIDKLIDDKDIVNRKNALIREMDEQIDAATNDIKKRYNEAISNLESLCNSGDTIESNDALVISRMKFVDSDEYAETDPKKWLKEICDISFGKLAGTEPEMYDVCDED